MESGELGIVADIWERDTAPVEDLEAMLFEHLVRQDHDMVHRPSIIIIGCGMTIVGRCEISSEKPERPDETDCSDESILGIHASSCIVEDMRRSEELLEMIKLSAYKDIEELIEPRAKFDHYCDKAIYHAKNEAIKRTIIPRRKRIRIHGRKR